jgi:LysR family transcriptional regulator for bpeEF and oprC
MLHGWFEAGSWVRRELPVMAQVTAATPEYWKRCGFPRHPRDLADHNCLSYRNPYGKLLDLWRYRSRGRKAMLSKRWWCKGWLNSNHRDNLLALALDHGGVMRIAYATAQADLASGRLVPALLDWEMMDPPPLAMYFRPELRRRCACASSPTSPPRTAELARLTDAKGQASVDGRPAWHHGNSRRASTWLSHR